MGDIVKTREILMEKEAAGQRVFRFESGNPCFNVSGPVKEAIAKALADNKTSYVPNAGIPQLKQAIVEKLGRQDLAITPNDVFVTNGAMHALYCVFQVLLDPGDEIIIPDPMWSEIADNIVLAGGVPVRVPVEDYANKIGDYINDCTKAIFINSPHNPTGLVHSEEDLKRISNISHRYGLTLVVDEAYEHINFTSERKTAAQVVSEDYSSVPTNTVLVYSFSKSYSMPGLRLGYIVATDRILHESLQKLLRCSVNGINSLSQWAGIAALKTSETDLKTMKEAYKLRGYCMYNALKRYDFLKPRKPNGAFYLWVETPHADKLVSSLINAGIGAVSGTAFGPGHSNFFRLSFACNVDTLIDGLETFDAGLA